MKQKTKFLIIFFVACVIAFFIRILFFRFLNIDLIVYVMPWYEFIQSHAGFAALKYDFSNYSPAYPTLLVFATYIKSLPSLINVKLISVFHDFLIALFAGEIIFVLTASKLKQLLIMIIVLFTPVVFINSAYWGQCDSIYTFWMVVSFYFLITERPLFAVIAFGMSFAFKFQAMFFGPILLIYYLKMKQSFYHLFLIPLIYLITGIPTLFAGRPLLDTLFIYFGQADYFHALTMSAPNMYVFLSNDKYELFVILGFLVSMVIFFIFMGLIYFYKSSTTPAFWLTAASVFLFLVPMLLPKMHERYFYPAVIFSLLWVMAQRDMLFYGVFLQITNILSYIFFLKNRIIVPIKPLALINILILFLVLFKVIKKYEFSSNFQFKFPL